MESARGGQTSAAVLVLFFMLLCRRVDTAIRLGYLVVIPSPYKSTKAAVVFLPEGTPHYGQHIRIPGSERLEGTKGETLKGTLGG